jgi:GNAT superfamily N-acetyltransferase
MSKQEKCSIETMTADMTEEVINLLARAYATNPINQAALEDSSVERNRAFFKIGLQTMNGHRVVAKIDGRIVGMAHWVDSEKCQPPELDKLKMAPTMIWNLGLKTSLRIMKWLTVWASRDPRAKHVHFGPIGVDPQMQGQGVGGALLRAHCEDLDRRGVMGYLETDRPENVPIYEKFGYRVVGEEEVLGVRNFFMERGLRS